jgi:hypothetical protein
MIIIPGHISVKQWKISIINGLRGPSEAVWARIDEMAVPRGLSLGRVKRGTSSNREVFMDPRPDQQKRNDRRGNCISNNPIEKDGSMDQPYRAAAYHDKQGRHSQQM